MLLAWLSFVLSFGLSLWLVPRVRAAALRIGFVDRPDGRLKRQPEPVPYLGGLAVYLAFLTSLALTFELSHEALGLLLASALVVVFGLIDDLGALSPWVKLAGQALACAVLVRAGIYIKLAFVPVWLAIPLTFLWLLATTNAFNLIDVMDGLSAGVAAIAALAIFALTSAAGRPVPSIMCLALAGSLLGFLRYNFEPARIYLGDTGSQFIGLMLGALAMNNSVTERNLVAVLAPVVILGVPLFDMLFVMHIRQLRGLPVMMGSPDHVALRLRKWRLTTKQTVLASYAAAALLGVAGVALTYLPSEEAALWLLFGLVALACGLALWLKRIDMSL
ncbi:MAG TPA: MraY family glycosyltransferase [Thermodesulfobacteriota bacterium]|nr:MraY family glycosyltransferase [Thermodesulfobacteriota bacterium]